MYPATLTTSVPAFAAPRVIAIDVRTSETRILNQLQNSMKGTAFLHKIDSKEWQNQKLIPENSGISNLRGLNTRGKLFAIFTRETTFLTSCLLSCTLIISEKIYTQKGNN